MVLAKKTIGRILLLLLLTGLLIISCKEKKIDVSRILQNVIGALNDRLPGGTITGAVIEQEDGIALYEIKKKIDETEYEATITPEGVIKEIEKNGEEIELTKNAANERKEYGEEKEDQESEEEENGSRESGEEWQDNFDIGRRTFQSVGENRYFILKPGYQLVLKGSEDNEQIELYITVLEKTKLVNNIETRIVEEKELKNGKIAEISHNFFAIDTKTNDVFYFGEETDIYKNGKITSHEGSWTAGTGNARAGIIIPGTIKISDRFYQEYAPGTAMDRAEITGLAETVKTPFGKFIKCLKVRESSSLEKGYEYKYYAPGIGLVQEEELVLVKHGFFKK